MPQRLAPSLEGALAVGLKEPLLLPCEHAPFALLFAFAELRSYPTPCCLHDGRIGLTASLLLAVRSHLLAGAVRSTDRVTTPRSWPSLKACR